VLLIGIHSDHRAAHYHARVNLPEEQSVCAAGARRGALRPDAELLPLPRFAKLPRQTTPSHFPPTFLKRTFHFRNWHTTFLKMGCQFELPTTKAGLEKFEGKTGTGRHTRCDNKWFYGNRKTPSMDECYVDLGQCGCGYTLCGGVE